ncbi:MAG TPA: hypothetical protein VLG40_01245 [Candidatus Saccharimonas sp.]|nr:hypothetical protein [Candidatus Saccharimonas sp.]
MKALALRAIAVFGVLLTGLCVELIVVKAVEGLVGVFAGTFFVLTSVFAVVTLHPEWPGREPEMAPRFLGFCIASGGAALCLFVLSFVLSR